MKIRLMGAEFFHADVWADRRTIMTKVMVDFPNFAKAPNILNSWALDRYSVHAVVLRDHQRIAKKLLRIFYNFVDSKVPFVMQLATSTLLVRKSKVNTELSKKMDGI